MRIKMSILTLAILGLLPPLHARLIRHWTYREMFNKADLVVVATYVSTKDTDDHTTLNDLNPPVNVVGVISEFKVSLVLKGAKDTMRFQLHHYRLESEDDLNIADGPNLLRVRGGNPAYLLFLVKERDGVYIPATGQTDPVGLAIGELLGGGD